MDSSTGEKNHQFLNSKSRDESDLAIPADLLELMQNITEGGIYQKFKPIFQEATKDMLPSLDRTEKGYILDESVHFVRGGKIMLNRSSQTNIIDGEFSPIVREHDGGKRTRNPIRRSKSYFSKQELATMEEVFIFFLLDNK